MKISKSLLQNIAVGLLMAGSITSCEVDDEPIGFHSETCSENCSIDHLKATTESETTEPKEATEPETTTILETIEESTEVQDGTEPSPEPEEFYWDWENCPGCGMG